MGKNPRKKRRNKESRRKAWMKRHVSRSGTRPDATEYRLHLLEQNETNVALALEQAIHRGDKNPVVFVIDCRDNVGYAIAAGCIGKDAVASHVTSISPSGAIPTMTLAIPHSAAVELLKTLKCSPVGLPRFSELLPDGWFHVVVVAAGGNMFLQVQPGYGLAEYEHGEDVEPPPESGEPAWHKMLTCSISEFRKAEEGKYLIMCLAMAVDAADYVYAPIVGWTDDFPSVSDSFARARVRLVVTFHKQPNMVFAAIATRSDTDDDIKGVFLAPLSAILRAAVQGLPFPGIKHDDITFLVTATRNVETAELAKLGMLSETMMSIPEGGNDGGTQEQTGGNKS